MRSNLYFPVVRVCIAFFLCAGAVPLGRAAGSEITALKLTLPEAVRMAMQQNPDVVLARLDEQSAALEAGSAVEPMIPRTTVISGLAYSTGFPLSVENAAPSVFRVTASRPLLDRARTYRAARLREQARGANLAAAAKQEEVALRTAALFLDLELAVRSEEIVARQLASLERILEVTQARTGEGRELALAVQRGQVDVERAQRKLESLRRGRRVQEQILAQVLGLGLDQRIEPVSQPKEMSAMPATEDECISQALESSKQIKQLESQLVASGFLRKEAKAARLPTVSLVADYALLARYNNYDRYFSAFDRHNAQAGAAIVFPLFAGPEVKARIAQADLEISRVRAELSSLRGHLTIEASKAWSALQDAESALELARMELNVARESVGVELSRLAEGKSTLAELERARLEENEKWLAFYEANSKAQAARLELLHRTGRLMAALLD